MLPSPSVLVYKKGFSYLWTVRFLKEHSWLFIFLWGAWPPALSPVGCPLPARLARLRQVPFSLLAKSDSFQGSIWLVLSSKGLVLILVSLFLCSWLCMSENRFLERLSHLLAGKIYFPQVNKWIIPVTRYSKYHCPIKQLVTWVPWWPDNPVLVQSMVSSVSQARDIYNYLRENNRTL